uniref:hypothetical protein n=1 Tax=Mesobacillus harenae TaxID=2213203 RepID=UPI00157FE4FE
MLLSEELKFAEILGGAARQEKRSRFEQLQKSAPGALQTVDKLDENRVCLQSYLVGGGMGAVDFRSRRFAFRGAGAEPPRRRW